MKKFICALFLLIISQFYAQDTLYFKNSDKLIVLLQEINPDNVKYKRFDNKTGPNYTVLKSELYQVVFANGIKEVFNKPNQIAKKDSVKTETSTEKKDAAADFFAESKPDTMIFKSGKSSIVKVLIVGEKEIRYKMFNYQDGPTYHAYKYEVSQIIFSTGRIQNFNETESIVKEEPVNNNNNNNPSGYAPAPAKAGTSLYQKGQEDGRRYYSHNGGSIATGCTAAGCTPLFGLIPAVIIANSEPDDRNLDIPPSNYSQNYEYVSGYRNAAFKIKRKKVWTAYGIGSGVSIVLIILGGIFGN